MQSDNGQESLWEQSDLLQLMASTSRAGTSEAGTGPSRPAGTAPAVPTAAPADQGAHQDSGEAAREHHPPIPTELAAPEPLGARAEPAAADPAGPADGNVRGAGGDGAPESSPASRLSLAGGGSPGAAGHPLLSRPAAAEGMALPACPRRLLILDTETTALSPDQGQCIEVGAVLFDVASRSVLMQVSFLLPCAHNAAEHVNGIPAAVSRLSQPWQQGLACFGAMVASADAVLAHNAGFDRQWFGRGELPALECPWICSMEDIRWPVERHLRPTPSVRDLALAYGVPVWEAHRALTDCIYLVQVFQRCEDLETLLQQALEPRQLVRARLSYDERQLAKDAGFRWNEPVPKAWSRRLSEREIAALPFAVDPVEPGAGRGDASRQWRRSA